MPGDPEIIFKKPPAREVQLAVQFPNNFEVADDRSRFHSLIKREFPLVVIPEQTKLPYDFGDYSIWTQNQANRHELFPSRDDQLLWFHTVSYAALPERAWNLFQVTNCKASQAWLCNTNWLPLAPDHSFEDCFLIDISLPTELQSNFYTGKGTLVFQEAEGFVMIELDPDVSGTQVNALNMNLTFAAHRELTVHDKRNDVAELI